MTLAERMQIQRADEQCALVIHERPTTRHGRTLYVPCRHPGGCANSVRPGNPQQLCHRHRDRHQKKEAA